MNPLSLSTLVLSVAVAFAKSSDNASCVTDLDCSLNGECVASSCVCDSGWKVGLGANQTQTPEYFGPNCGLRHCPSGDDPVTLHVNELNCTNVTAEGGHGVGMPGNHCHVDCSNRGLCDYSSGVCTCFDGFFGANCGTPVSAFTLVASRTTASVAFNDVQGFSDNEH